MLTEVDHIRLVRLLTLAGDEAATPGEAVNALRAAHRLLDRAGLTWAAVLSAARGAGPADGPAPEPEPPPERDAAEARRRAAALISTEWFAGAKPFAVEFVAAMARWTWVVSPKQWRTLEECEREAARAQRRRRSA